MLRFLRPLLAKPAAARPTVRTPAPTSLRCGDRDVPLAIVASPRARRLSLRADSVRGQIRVSLPPRVRLAEATAFIAAHHDWIAARVARWPVASPFVAGATIPFDGAPLLLDWRADHPRGIRRDGDRLVIGGPRETVPGRTARWLKAQALAAMTAPTQDLAAAVDRKVTKVSVRDPAGRWGSCSSSGAIGYSWRLILAPEWVRNSVVAHEVAHLVHPNHGREFWVLAAKLNGGDPSPARAWLGTHGPGLHWVGRAD